jgi:polygalacturonase
MNTTNSLSSTAIFRRLCRGCAVAILACSAGGQAQTATGDGRGTVAEPTFPAVCATVTADLTISGGEPSSELNTATDTTALQTGLSTSGCSGKAVEVVAGSGGQNAMVISPIFIPSGVTLLVDGGVTIFASKNAADYQIGTATTGNTCGTTDGGSACNPLITVGASSINGQSGYTGAVVTGLMGYGQINGRGGDKLITISGSTVTTMSNSWWDLATSGTEDVPILVSLYKVAAAQLYKITLLNSPHFHVKLTGQASTSKTTNFTVWGIKLLTPYSAKNTDGIDPTGVVNMTVQNSLIGDGDDESAISGSSLTQNFTYNNLLLASGHGLSIGSITTSAVSNVLVENVNFSGQAADSNEIALRIKSYCGDGGGQVSLVTYQNVCMQNVKAAIELDPFYSTTSSTSSCPLFGTVAAPITYSNIYSLTPASYINLQGYGSSNLSTVTLNNVYVNTASATTTLPLGKIQSADTAPTPQDVNITLNGNYYPNGWAALGSTANGVTETLGGTASAASSFPAAPCANAFPTLMGELYASTTTGGVTANNITPAVTSANAAAVTIPATVTLNAVVLPTNSEATYSPYTGAAAPTAGVQFFDGATSLGTSALGANGTLASLTVTNPVAGTHSYTAMYVGDTTYGATTLGANTSGTEAQTLTVKVTAGPATKLAFRASPVTPVVYGNSPGTVTVIAQDAAGDALTTLSATVTLTVTGANSYTATYTATPASGVATFSSIANPPAIGTYTYTATATGLTSAAANELVSAATLTVTAQPASRIFGDPNPAFSYAISGYGNGDTSAVVSGSPTLTTTALRDSNAGPYPIAVAVGTLSAANYVFATMGSTFTINGGAPQSVVFYPLANFVHGSSYQLSAMTTSGLPVTYAVSGSGASISGSTLTVPSAGSVTVTASQAGNGNYAAASSAQQSFTAQ